MFKPHKCIRIILARPGILKFKVAKISTSYAQPLWISLIASKLLPQDYALNSKYLIAFAHLWKTGYPQANNRFKLC